MLYKKVICISTENELFNVNEEYTVEVIDDEFYIISPIIYNQFLVTELFDFQNGKYTKIKTKSKSSSEEVIFQFQNKPPLPDFN